MQCLSNGSTDETMHFFPRFINVDSLVNGIMQYRRQPLNQRLPPVLHDTIYMWMERDVFWKVEMHGHNYRLVDSMFIAICICYMLGPSCLVWGH